MGEWTVEPFGKDHERSKFSCGRSTLDDFIRAGVVQYGKRRLGMTFVALPPNEKRVIGGRAAPAVQRSIFEVGEDSRRLAGFFETPFRLLGGRGRQVPQPLVLGQADHLVDMVRFAPSEQVLAVEAAVAANDDLHLGPGGANPPGQLLERLERAGRSVEVARPQLGVAQMVAAKDVEGEITIPFLVVVEEAARLVAMDGVVGGVEVEDDSSRRSGAGFQKEVDEKGLRLGDVERRLGAAGVAVGADKAAFDAVQSALAGHGTALVSLAAAFGADGVLLADGGGQRGVAAEQIVVDEVLVSLTDGEDALLEEVRERVLDEVGIAMVGEALGEAGDDASLVFNFGKQQDSAVAGDVAAVEIGDDLAFAERLEVDPRLSTLCLHWAAPLSIHNSWLTTLLW